MIRALIFDMDGLLLDSERIVQRSWYMMGEELGIPELGSHIYNTLGLNRAARSEYFYQALGEDFPMERFLEGTRKYFYQIVKQEGLPVKKGARELLIYGRRNGYKLAVATSSTGDYAKKVLKDAGIWQYFDAAVFGDMVTETKPNPQIYLKACEKVDVDPADAMAFEDAPNGIRASHAAGMTTVMVPDLVRPTEELEKFYDYCVDSLLKVPQLLEKLRLK